MSLSDDEANADLAQPSDFPITPFLDSLTASSGIPEIFTLQLCDVTASGMSRTGMMVSLLCGTVIA